MAAEYLNSLAVILKAVLPSLLDIKSYLLPSKATGTQLSEESHRLVGLMPEF